MKLRSLAGTVGAFALVGALVLGTAAPASAYIITPVSFPTCSEMVSARTVGLWGVSPSLTPTAPATSIPSVRSTIEARSSRTCSWTLGTKRGTITEVRTLPEDFATIRAAYLAAGFTESAPHLATTPVPSTVRVFSRSTKTSGEVAYLSPDGWLITATDNGTGILGSFFKEAAGRFLALNPRLR
jgi:hypothetical protein